MFHVKHRMGAIKAGCDTLSGEVRGLSPLSDSRPDTRYST